MVATLGQSEVLHSAAPNRGNRGTAWNRGNSEQTDAKKPIVSRTFPSGLSLSLQVTRCHVTNSEHNRIECGDLNAQSSWA